MVRRRYAARTGSHLRLFPRSMERVDRAAEEVPCPRATPCGSWRGASTTRWPATCSRARDLRVPALRHRRPRRTPGARDAAARQAPAHPGRRRPHAAHAPAHGRHVAPLPPGHPAGRGGPDHQVRVVLATDDVGRRSATGCPSSSSSRPRTRTTPSGTSVRTCSTPPSTATRRCAGWLADPTARSAQALLDQRSSPGSATSTRTETLFVRRTSPWTPVGEVDDLGRAGRPARSGCSSANKAHASQTTTGDPRRGLEHWVYGRAGRPCRRCGTRIRDGRRRERRRTTGSRRGAPPASPART